MKLTAFLINGEPVGVVIKQWSSQELNGNPPFHVEETVSNGYLDISSAENWDASDMLDWSRRRDMILPIIYAITGLDMSGYGNLTASQKLIAAKYFLVPYSLRVTNGIVTDAQDKENWQYLLAMTKQSRISCVEAMRICVGDYIRTGELSLAETQKFFVDVFDMISWFESANVPDFKQWLTNEVGSPYENNGFEQKTYYSAQLESDLLDIYNGNYGSY